MAQKVLVVLGVNELGSQGTKMPIFLRVYKHGTNII